MTATQLDLLHPQRSQKSVVLSHLQSGQSLTSGEAWARYGITRLAAIVIRLRREGYRIDTVLTDVPTRNGGSRVAVYRMGA